MRDCLLSRVEFEGPKTTLYIRGAKMTDAGWFQCTATSPAGTCVTKCKVTVIRMSFFLIKPHWFPRLLRLALSEASQYPKELPQFGPQHLSKVPGYVSLVNAVVPHRCLLSVYRQKTFVRSTWPFPWSHRKSNRKNCTNYQNARRNWRIHSMKWRGKTRTPNHFHLHPLLFI